MQGFYRFDYAGHEGEGSGALAFANGKVGGIDVGGAHYAGEYTEVDGRLVGKLSMSMPNGGRLVTGAEVAPGMAPIEIPFSAETAQLDGRVIRIETPTGPVNVRLTLIASL
jgi:hypothetical protein